MANWKDLPIKEDAIKGRDATTFASVGADIAATDPGAKTARRIVRRKLIKRLGSYAIEYADGVSGMLDAIGAKADADEEFESDVDEMLAAAWRFVQYDNKYQTQGDRFSDQRDRAKDELEEIVAAFALILPARLGKEEATRTRSTGRVSTIDVWEWD